MQNSDEIDEPRNDIKRGVFFIICSAFFFALMAVFVKLAGNIHFIQKAFFRNVVAFMIALGGTIKDVRLNGRQAIIIPKGALFYLFLRAIAGSMQLIELFLPMQPFLIKWGLFSQFYSVILY